MKGVLKDLLRGFLKENLTVDESSSSDELLTQYLKFSDVVRKYVRSLKKYMFACVAVMIAQLLQFDWCHLHSGSAKLQCIRILQTLFLLKGRAARD